MRKTLFKIVLLVIVIMISNFCLGQIKEVHYIFSKDGLAMDSSIYIDNYYKNNIIRHKTFYDKAQREIKEEFIRVGADKYFYYQYDTIGQVENQGIAILNKNPTKIDSVGIFDSIGNFKSKGTVSFFTFYKDEYWNEKIDSVNYLMGNYKEGEKDSIWEEVKNDKIEFKLFYRNGILQKTDTVNLIYKTTNQQIQALTKKWAIDVDNYRNTNVVDFVYGKNSDNGRYIEFKKDGTYVFHFRMIENGTNETGTWKLGKDKKLVMVSSSDKQKDKIAIISYLSRNYLTLTFEQYK